MMSYCNSDCDVTVQGGWAIASLVGQHGVAEEGAICIFDDDALVCGAGATIEMLQFRFLC